MRLTRNFTREEFTYSQTATRRGIDNSIPIIYIDNLIRLACFCQRLRDKLSAHYGKEMPVVISSGYRCPKLNKRLKGAKNSAHMRALAADLLVPGLSARDLMLFIKMNMKDEVDQAILEFDRWVHVAIPEKGEPCRKLFLRAKKVKGRFGRTKTAYEIFIS